MLVLQKLLTAQGLSVPVLNKHLELLICVFKRVKRFWALNKHVKRKLQLDVEPISGLTMRSRFRLQLNTAILQEFISCPRQRHLNVSYISDGRPHRKVVPIYWVEQGGEIDETSAKEFQTQVSAYSITYSM